MASGKPDWNRIVTIQGKYDEEWLPMKVDSTGQLFIALTGQEIDVNQIDADRNMMGDKDGEKKYIAVDPDGVMLCRMKGRYGPSLVDVIVDASGVMLTRMKGSFWGALKDIAVDTNGNMISVIKGDDSGTLRTVYVDDTGKMVTRIQGATGGDLVVYVLDDCGDSDNVSNWAGAIDALDPVISTTFVREGSKSMELGIDASKNGADYATWVNQQTKGDLTGLNNDKVKIWVWISTVDYLLAAGTALKYGIGSGTGDFYYFNFTKAQLVQGWNELECDLSSPDGSTGSPDWSAIDVQFFDVYEIVSNTDDFYIIVDSIVIVRDNPAPGTLKDLNTDANGFLLSKMVGSFGDYLKPLTCDRHGNLRVNPTQTDKRPVMNTTHFGKVDSVYVTRVHPGVEDYVMTTIAGPGVILGGALRHYHTNSHSACRVYVIIDDITLEAPTFAYLEAFGTTIRFTSIPYFLRYDNTAYRYAVGFPEGVTFRNSFKVCVDENVGAGSSDLYLYYATY